MPTPQILTDFTTGVVPLTTTATTIGGTVAANHVRRSMTALVCNTNNTVQSFCMSIGTDSIGTRIFSDYVLAPNDTFNWDGTKLVIPAGGFFQVKASSTGINIYICGTDVTNA